MPAKQRLTPKERLAYHDVRDSISKVGQSMRQFMTTLRALSDLIEANDAKNGRPKKVKPK